MNTRYEGGSIDSAQDILNAVHYWAEEEEIESIEEETDTYITYFTGYETRTLYFPETDSIERIKNAIHCDDGAKKRIDLDNLSKFLYQHIDRYSLMSLENFVLIWDEYDDQGELIPQKARQSLCEMYGDEYALEIGDKQLGVVWVERSDVIINVLEIQNLAVEIWNDTERNTLYSPISNSVYKSQEEVFRDIFVSTVCHELRHLLYECNEYAQIFHTTSYPSSGALEEEVEQFGNDEAFRLLKNTHASNLIDKAVKMSKCRSQEKQRD